MKSGITVGVTFFVSQTHDSIWSNGAVQNVIFLYMLLCNVPSIKRVVLINGGDREEPLPGLMLDGMNLVFHRLSDVIDDLDVLIEAGAQVDSESIDRIRRRGGKAVAYRVGNDYVMDVERVIFGRPSGSIFNGSCFDEVWTIPQHESTCKSYFEVMHRCPVRIMPHIWSSFFLEKAVLEMPDDLNFGYQPGAAGKRVSIFEPNVNVVKTCHYPLMVCEMAYRSSPELLREVYVTNALHLKDHVTFQHFIGRMDIARDKVVSVEARYNLPFFLAKYTDVVVTHHWENSLNYMYYDALYGGYPLVHNSDLLPCGYYYRSFDAADGGRVLEKVIRDHDRSSDEYRHRAHDFLGTLGVGNPRNVYLHEEALQALFRG